MTSHLKILILEDKASDAELVKLQLEDLDFRFEFSVIDKREDFIRQLETDHPDIIISDFNLPRFDGMKALKILRDQDDLTPFIFVTGTMGEENAVGAIRAGASDFIIKQQIEQLPAALIRALREREEKQSKKAMAKRLVESEQNYRNLFHLSPLPMWLYDTQTYQFLKVNEAAIRNYGYTEAEFLSMTIKDIRPEEDVSLVVETVDDSRKTGKRYQGTFRHKKKSGEIIYVEIQSTDLDHNESNTRLVVSNDVTEKMHAEEALLRSEERFKALVQEGSDLIGIMDQEGNYLFVSDSTKAILGIDSNELVGKNAYDFVHPEDRSLINVQLSKLTEQNQVQLEPFRFRDVANEWRWIQTTATDLSDDPAVGGIVINSRDITQAIYQEQKLKLINERYRLAAMATKDLIFDWDLKADKVYRVAEAMENLFGYKQEETRGGDFWKKCVHPEDADQVYAYLNDRLKSRKGDFCQQRYRFRRADGTYAHVEDSGYILRNEKGEPIRLVGATTDITVSVERETEHQLLAELSRTLGQPGPIQQIETALRLLIDHGGLIYAEAWLTNIDHKKLNLIGRTYSTETGESFATKTKAFREVKMGEGLPGEVWKSRKILIWENIGESAGFLRKEVAESANMLMTIGAPIFFNDEVIGVFLFFGDRPHLDLNSFKRLLNNLSHRFGAELQRKISEEELNRFFNLSPDLLSIAGMDGYFKKVNPAFTRLLGYSEKELLETPFLELTHPDDREGILRGLGNLEEGASYFFESRALAKNGEEKWLSWTTSPLPEEGLSFNVAKDVTERKMGEKELIKLNKQLKTAQQISKLGYWTHYLSTNRGEWSEEVYAIWERAPSVTITFEDFLDTIYPEDRHLFLVSPEDLPVAHYAEVEHRILTPTGKLKWIFQRMNLIRDRDGKAVRLEGVAQDITEKKKLETEREAILESITDGFFAVDEQWTVTYWNKAAEDILQVSKEKVLNKNLWDVSEDLVKLKSYDQFDQALKSREARNFEEHFPALDIWVELSVFPKGDGLSVYLKNISERKQHQREIIRTIQETQEKERARLGRDLHDGLTQSLTAIKMNLAHLKEKLERGETRMNLLDTTIEYVNNSINESRSISHGLLSVTLENYGLIKALDEIVSNINVSGKLQMVFENHFSKNAVLPKELEVNIYRIVQEAINNIMKHSEASEARIMLIADAESIQLIISDNGKGIAGLSSGEFEKGAGLRNLKVRVEGFDGHFTLLNRKQGGLQIHIVFSKFT